jgi:hypothetical protein
MKEEAFNPDQNNELVKKQLIKPISPIRFKIMMAIMILHSIGFSILQIFDLTHEYFSLIFFVI